MMESSSNGDDDDEEDYADDIDFDKNGEEEKHGRLQRKCPRTEYHPWQRRKLKIDNDDDNDDENDEHEGGNNGHYVTSSHFQQDLVAPFPHQQIRRPFPSTMALSSTQMATEELSRIYQAPFLHGFSQLVGFIPSAHDMKGLTSERLEDDDDNDDDAQNESHLQDIDKTSLSNLTPAQHRRYLRLVECSERWTPLEKVHWKQLKDIVRTEQVEYQTAVETFWLNHKEDRLLLGFLPQSSSSQPSSSSLKGPSSSSNRLRAFCQWACQESLERKVSLLTKEPIQPTLFGKCRQTISLRSMKEDTNSLPDVTGLEFQRIYPPSRMNMTHTISELPSVGSEIPIPLRTNGKGTMDRVPLIEDDIGFKLASKHKATMMISDQTLERLLQLPGKNKNISWLLPVSIKDEIIVLDTMFEQAFSTPRECLTCGVGEGLCRQMDSMMVPTTKMLVDKNDSSSSSSTSDSQYEYTLWTLPPASSSFRSSVKVLIRSEVQHLWEPSGNPLKLRAHVEYFPERGEEIVSQYELSLWILDQLLIKSTQMCRVDGRTGTILRWHEAGIAHAFASDTSQENPMQGFAQVIQLFHAVSTIDFGPKHHDDGVDGGTSGPFGLVRSRLLSLPCLTEPSASTTTSSDPFSVSVHAPAKDDDIQTFDIHPYLEKAGGVIMNLKAIQECHRPWRWDVVDRIPYTFPTKKRETNISSSRPSKR